MSAKGEFFYIVSWFETVPPAQASFYGVSCPSILHLGKAFGRNMVMTRVSYFLKAWLVRMRNRFLLGI